MHLDWHYYPETGSTQDLAKEWGRGRMACRLSQEEDAEEAVAVFYTFNQGKGRGQAGNTWFCGQDRNLALSLGFLPRALDTGSLFALDMALSSGVRRFALRFGPDFCLKWPNDLYAKGKKMAGILMETRVQAGGVQELYWGIGWNVNQKLFPEQLPNPVSLWQYDGRTRDLETMARDLALAVVLAYEDFCRKQREAGAGVFGLYKQEYLESLLFYGEDRDYMYKGNLLRARIEDVDEDGYLLLRDTSGRLVRAGIKELQYLLR